MPTTTVPRSRFQELVAKKRAEREAKEQAEREKVQAARKQESEKQKKLAKQYKEIYSSEMDDGMTEDARKVLEESSRPAQRKASKKALEEMNRETQRMARNQQLTHQARVKRKITTLDFVKSFGMAVPDSDDRPQSRGALVSSDNEGNARKDTPPSSPPSVRGSPGKVEGVALPAVDEEEYIIRTGSQAEGDDEELPDIDQLLSDPPRLADKGKGKAVAPSPKAKMPRKQIRVSAPPRTEDSDDDLEIVTTMKPSRFAVFDKLPERNANEPKSLLNLRNLAHMSPPSKNSRNSRHSMTAAQLHVQLVQQMHKQTVADKQERIEALRARGIEFKTEEEIEEDQLYIENMLEKARKEAMELGLKENEAAKKNGEDIDENYALSSEDEDEDAEYDEEDEEDEEADVEMSGSEEEDAGEHEDEPERSGLFDDAAEDADEDEDVEAEDEDEREDAVMDNAPEVQAEADDDDAITVQTSRSKPRNRNVVLDDDEDEAEEPAKPPTPNVADRTSTQTSPINAFGFAMPNADLGLTQMFKGTMEELATQDETTQATPARSLDFLRDAPAPTLPDMSPALPPAGLLVPSSQALATPSKQRQAAEGTPHFTPQFPTPARVGSQISPTKLSEIPEPTQDAGFDSSLATRAEQPYSTIDTVMMPVAESPVALKKGKLRRRAQRVAELSDDEAAQTAADDTNEGDFELTTNAFDALFKAAKKPAQPETFDKKRSEAKAMFEEQAEESEDEYAGLGGASDDESDNGIDEEVQKMIDEGPVDVKEGELAQLFADRDRADDEKRIDRLYKDITTGALRRKRGVGVDELSDDSDDEAAERRRRKQAEFRKMRQALLLDENVGKIGQNFPLAVLLPPY
jgi:mediator of replication checkpoint protein 1